MIYWSIDNLKIWIRTFAEMRNGKRISRGFCCFRTTFILQISERYAADPRRAVMVSAGGFVALQLGAEERQREDADHRDHRGVRQHSFSNDFQAFPGNHRKLRTIRIAGLVACSTTLLSGTEPMVFYWDYKHLQRCCVVF